jgi:hypothetical protein
MGDETSDPDGPRDPRPDDDLPTLVEELSTTLESLRGTLGPDRRASPEPRPPTPPTPRELLRFTEQYTIPTLIALLESGVRSLELLAATLRLLDGRGVEAASPATRERVQSVGRTTLDRVDTVLADLQSAVEGGEPSDPTARDLLADARSLRDEIDGRLRETDEERDRERDRTDRHTSGRAPADGREIPVQDAGRSEPTGADGDDGPVEHEEDVGVDVEAELESIRRDVRGAGGGTTEPPGEPTDADAVAGEGHETGSRTDDGSEPSADDRDDDMDERTENGR